VELVPGVKNAFGFYHSDAARVLANPKGRIVIDDGRRFLNRTREKFDIIVIDPPPPVEAAGSSLLYSKEFYEAAKRRLNPHGILQAWYPGGSHATFQAVVRSVRESFPHVRCFRSVGKWGTHILASMEPIPSNSAAGLAARLPVSAAADLLEWSMSPNPRLYLDEVLSQEVPVEEILGAGQQVRITDDRPYNEYFLLRQSGLLNPNR
jgi:predicted membrane-bound spermidine synthase